MENLSGYNVYDMDGNNIGNIKDIFYYYDPVFTGGKRKKNKKSKRAKHNTKRNTKSKSRRNKKSKRKQKRKSRKTHRR